jgi:cytochrome c biogenesis protein CcmG, thiol:disulfide interchange protein DsbE
VRSWLSWGVVAVSAALVGLLAYGIAATGEDSSIEEALGAGDRIEAPAADTALPVLGKDGEGTLADYRGKVVILNFWASWCPPCVDELPLLQRTQERIAGQDATVVGVNYKDLPEKAQRFVDRYSLTYPSLRDREGEVAEQYGARAFPETFVIDRDGRIAAVRRGPVTQEWLDRTLPELLGERA